MSIDKTNFLLLFKKAKIGDVIITTDINKTYSRPIIIKTSHIRCIVFNMDKCAIKHSFINCEAPYNHYLSGYKLIKIGYKNGR